MIASEQPAVGVMETDWAENRAEVPNDLFRKYIGKYIDVFYSTYKRDKFRTRIERGTEPGTVEIYVSHRGMEQMPTTKIDNVQGAGFAWAVMPPESGARGGDAVAADDALRRAGDASPKRRVTPAAAANAPKHARLEKGRWLLEADRRRSIRPRVAPRRPGTRPHRLHRRRSRSLDRHSTSCASPIRTPTWRGRTARRASSRS